MSAKFRFIYAIVTTGLYFTGFGFSLGICFGLGLILGVCLMCE